MKNIFKISFIVLFASILCFWFGGLVSAQTTPEIQTNSAINIQNNSATLNANITDLGNYGSATVYFQWGISTSYGYQTPIMTQNYIGSFSQTISGLAPNTTFHFRAVAQNNYGTVYGQDMTFVNGQSNGGALTANAGPDLYLTSGQNVTLQGYGYDPNGYALSYYWTCNGGTLSNYNIAQPAYAVPYTNSYNNQTTYTCTLTVTNSYGGSNSDSMIVYVNYNNANNNSNNYVQTNSATNISNYQATLNGYLSGGGSYNIYVWFQWGADTNYGNTTPQQTLNYSGSFSQNIANLNYNAAYHFRAVAQGSFGTVYGQDMTFYSSNSGYHGNGNLIVSKQVIDLTSGNSNWQTSANVNPSDVLSFAIILQTNGQDAHDVMVRDILPANLIYKGNLTVNTNSNYGGNITSGVNIGTVYANQPIIVAYQAQVAPTGNFSYGATTLTNNATVTSSESGTQTSSASVIVNKSQVYGASTVSTGLTSNFLTDSFFLPLLLIVAGLWFYFSGNLNKFVYWLKQKI